MEILLFSTFFGSCISRRVHVDAFSFLRRDSLIINLLRIVEVEEHGSVRQLLAVSGIPAEEVRIRQEVQNVVDPDVLTGRRRLEKQKQNKFLYVILFPCPVQRVPV